MPSMDPETFAGQIRSKDRKTFYLVRGSEPTGVERCLAAAKAAVDPDFFQMNYRQFRIDDFGKGGWSKLDSVVTANPFGKPPRIVVVKVAATDKFPPEGVEALGRAKAKVSPAATLVFFCEEIPDARLKVFKDIAKEGLEVDCQAPEGRELPGWLISRFKMRGATLTMDGAKAIIERAGDDIGVLDGEAEKLSIFPGAGKPIGPQEAMRWVSLSPTAEIYELGSPLGEGRLDKALPTLLDLLGTDEPIRLIYAIGTHFRRLLALKALMLEKGGGADDAYLASAIKVKPLMMRYLRPQLERWTVPRIKEAISALEKAHMDLFTSRVGQDVIIEALAVKLGVLGGGGDRDW